MARPVVIGIDPDSKTTAWAAVSGSTLKSVGIFKTPKARTVAAMLRLLAPAIESMLLSEQPDLVVIEGQQIYRDSAAPPEDIIKLAHISGGIAGLVAGLVAPGPKIAIPTPKEWKGSTPKPINQSRSYAHFGILSTLASGYARPTGCKVLARVKGAAGLNRSDWKHVGDSLGLARYGDERLL